MLRPVSIRKETTLRENLSLFSYPPPRTANQEGDKISQTIHVRYGRNVIRALMSDLLLLGVGMVLRLERDARSSAELIRQATKEYTPFASPLLLRAFFRVPLSGFDSRLALTDLLKATGASIIPLARPRKAENGSGREGLSTNGAGALAPTLSWDYSSTAVAAPCASAVPAAAAATPASGASAFVAPASSSTAATSSASAASASTSDIDDSVTAANAATSGFDLPETSDAPSAGDHLNDDRQTSEGALTSSPTAGVDIHAGAGNRSLGVGAVRAAVPPTRLAKAGGDAETEQAEARLRVVSAAMRTVSAALSALSVLRDDGECVESDIASHGVGVSFSEGSKGRGWDRDRDGDGAGGGDRKGNEQGAVVPSEALSSLGEGITGVSAGTGRVLGGNGSGASVRDRTEGSKETGIAASAAAANAAANADAGSLTLIEHNDNLDVTAAEVSARSAEGLGVAAAAVATGQTFPTKGSNTSQNRRQNSPPAQAQAVQIDESSGRYRLSRRITDPRSREEERALRDGDDSEAPPGGRVGEGTATVAAEVAAPPVIAATAAGHTRTVGAVAEVQSDEVEGRSSAAKTPGAYGRKLTRTAGTPTVDAIGGDVHLVAVVAGKRSLTRLLHFVDLVREWGGGG